MNDPFVPLPPAWHLISHDDQSIDGEPYSTTGYERKSDRLRVFVSDVKSDSGLDRTVSASAPPPANRISISQEREIRRLFLHPDRPIRTKIGPTRSNVSFFLQTIEGEKSETYDGQQILHNLPLAKEMLRDSDRDEWRINLRGEDVIFRFELKSGYWRYEFLGPGGTTHSSFEWPMRDWALHAAIQHYETVRAGFEFKRPAVPDGRKLASSSSQAEKG